MVATTLPRSRPLGAVVWFVWMVAMWIGFLGLLLGERLDGVRDWVRELPLLVEGLAWLALFPWLLGTAVWTSSWPDALRVLLVALFAAGWTLVSIPRAKPGRTP
jgi:hypothetical protein